MQNSGQQVSLRCVVHRNSYYQALSLKKENTNNRLLCIECLLPEEYGNTKKEFIDLIPLSIAINSPQQMLNWMQKESGSQYIEKLVQYAEKDLEKEFNEQINKFDSMIKIIERCKQQIRQEMQEYKNQQVQFKKYKESFYEKINYNKFCYLLFQLQELDKQFQSDQYTQVAKELSKTIDEMLKDNCALITKEINVIQQEHNKIVINLQKPSFEELQKQINQLFQSYDQYIQKLNEDVKAPQIQLIQKKELQYPQFKVLSNEYFKIIEKKIENDSQKETKQINLIYLGSRDGLNKDAFWSKVKGKKQLLMIFKSKNNGNYIFGGYSPCQWQSNLSNSVQDDTLTSFLFSQTHNQIYPLKQDQKGYAIYCGQGHGPIFGNGNDIYINVDFNQGYSNLGNTYQWDQYKGQKSEHLFGGAQPNISECEIYEILFA